MLDSFYFVICIIFTTPYLWVISNNLDVSRYFTTVIPANIPFFDMLVGIIYAMKSW